LDTWEVEHTLYWDEHLRFRIRWLYLSPGRERVLPSSGFNERRNNFYLCLPLL